MHRSLEFALDELSALAGPLVKRRDYTGVVTEVARGNETGG